MAAQYSQSADKIDVSYVAHLARMYLSDDERDLFQSQLEQILAYVDQLKELDVEGIEPMAHAVPVENVFREDATRTSLEREKAMQNAPQDRDGEFVVPTIIE